MVIELRCVFDVSAAKGAYTRRWRCEERRNAGVGDVLLELDSLRNSLKDEHVGVRRRERVAGDGHDPVPRGRVELALLGEANLRAAYGNDLLDRGAALANEVADTELRDTEPDLYLHLVHRVKKPALAGSRHALERRLGIEREGGKRGVCGGIVVVVNGAVLGHEQDNFLGCHLDIGKGPSDCQQPLLHSGSSLLLALHVHLARALLPQYADTLPALADDQAARATGERKGEGHFSWSSRGSGILRCIGSLVLRDLRDDEL